MPMNSYSWAFSTTGPSINFHFPFFLPRAWIRPSSRVSNGRTACRRKHYTEISEYASWQTSMSEMADPWHLNIFQSAKLTENYARFNSWINPDGSTINLLNLTLVCSSLFTRPCNVPCQSSCSESLRQVLLGPRKTDSHQAWTRIVFEITWSERVTCSIRHQVVKKCDFIQIHRKSGEAMHSMGNRSSDFHA